MASHRLPTRRPAERSSLIRLTVLAAFVTLALSMTDLAAGEAPANETCPAMAADKVDPRLLPLVAATARLLRK